MIVYDISDFRITVIERHFRARLPVFLSNAQRIVKQPCRPDQRNAETATFLVERRSDAHRCPSHCIAVTYDVFRRTHAFQNLPALSFRRIFIPIIVLYEIRISLLRIHIEHNALAVSLQIDHFFFMPRRHRFHTVLTGTLQHLRRKSRRYQERMPLFSFVARYDKAPRRLIVPVEKRFDDVRRNQRNIHRCHQETVVSVFVRRPDSRLNRRKHSLFEFFIIYCVHTLVSQKIAEQFRLKSRHHKNVVHSGFFKMPDEDFQRIVSADFHQRFKIFHSRRKSRR